MIEKLNLSLPKGSSLLIQGKSGSGKTTLLRTVAGLWICSEGVVMRPTNALFLSQKPYLPQGRLIDAIYYPNIAPDAHDETVLQMLLQKVQLGHLVDKLTQTCDWTHVLSLGEQQRLAFARLLLLKPDVAFLDEASASMDEGLEDAMYRLLKESLPNTTIISVGHRSTLQKYHQQTLQIHENKNWNVI